MSVDIQGMISKQICWLLCKLWEHCLDFKRTYLRSTLLPPGQYDVCIELQGNTG